MDMFNEACHFLPMASMILLLLLQAHETLEQYVIPCVEEDEEPTEADFGDLLEPPILDDLALNRTVIHQFRLWTTVLAFDEELRFWVKPRSTTWFAKFLLHEYDNDRWIHFFRMTKECLLQLAELLTPFIRKQDTNYRLCIPVTVRVACAIFKLCNGVPLMICSEFFAIGKSTVSIVLRDVVHAVNIGLRGEIQWPQAADVPQVEAGFRRKCGLPGVLGAIDGTHFAIGKPKVAPGDYFHHKSGAYSMQCQAVVDSSKCFMAINVGMPGSTNDARVLRRSALYDRGQRGTLWEGGHSFNGFPPYLLGDGGYPLLPWLMVPHRRIGPVPMAARLFNRRLSKGRVVVENAFGTLKQTFRELHKKTDLHVTFLPDVILCCAILHNVLLKDSHEDVESALRGQVQHDDDAPLQSPDSDHDGECDQPVEENNDTTAEQRREQLGVFLSLRST